VAEDGNQTELRSVGPRIPPRRLSEPEYAAASRQRNARVAAAGVIALALGLVVVAIIGRDGIMAMWPSSAGMYRAANMVPGPGDGLKMTLTVTRTGGGFTVAGNIVNNADASREVPPLRVSLQDVRRNDVDVKTIDPPVAHLAPGAAARFETVFEHPSMLATGAAAVFAPGR
jgi:hypothetical protein